MVQPINYQAFDLSSIWIRITMHVSLLSFIWFFWMILVFICTVSGVSFFANICMLYLSSWRVITSIQWIWWIQIVQLIPFLHTRSERCVRLFFIFSVQLLPLLLHHSYFERLQYAHSPTFNQLTILPISYHTFHLCGHFISIVSTASIFPFSTKLIRNSFSYFYLKTSQRNTYQNTPQITDVNCWMFRSPLTHSSGYSLLLCSHLTTLLPALLHKSILVLRFFFCTHQLVSYTFFFYNHHFIISWGIIHQTFHYFPILKEFKIRSTITLDIHLPLHTEYSLLPLLHKHPFHILAPHPFLWTFFPSLVNVFSHFGSRFNSIPSHFFMLSFHQYKTFIYSLRRLTLDNSDAFIGVHFLFTATQ